MAERKASRTAVLVCQGRAVADGRLAVGRFSDPIAIELLTAPEREMVGTARSGVMPSGFGARLEYELLKGTSEILAARTVAIDDVVRDRGHPQLVILGAGLDARAWRMKELAEATVYEIDQPASQQEKRERLGDRAPLAAAVHFVPVDFAKDSLGTALEAAGHDATIPTTWIWEGVIPYLTPAQVAATTAVVGEHSAAGSRLILNYATTSRLNAFGRRAVQRLLTLAGRDNPMANEPFRSAWSPETLRELLSRSGFDVTVDVGLLAVAHDLDMSIIERTRFLGSGRIAVADRD
ncbi:SAM-dependent methyltransferase [Nocardia sp. SYP-A9097]|uniref:class I SAM-dependent methyltransferase n=1 Tax=Nocardia sp. SYP-A9097 TaxID=2663237 RepID=UPI00129B2FDE|nr:class I SAM-dependent methyltransferase [Nocardia sp. SYP-A9097]MRH87520.1 SAM-dependent methyltransferase [Nocardia sp. SYP-A9097]